jgi:hypothetical protein
LIAGHAHHQVGGLHKIAVERFELFKHGARHDQADFKSPTASCVVGWLDFKAIKHCLMP